MAPRLGEQVGWTGVFLNNRASRKKMSLVVHPWPRFLPIMAQIHLYLLNDMCVSSLGPILEPSTHTLTPALSGNLPQLPQTAGCWGRGHTLLTAVSSSRSSKYLMNE